MFFLRFLCLYALLACCAHAVVPETNHRTCERRDCDHIEEPNPVKSTLSKDQRELAQLRLGIIKKPDFFASSALVPLPSVHVTQETPPVKPKLSKDERELAQLRLGIIKKPDSPSSSALVPLPNVLVTQETPPVKPKLSKADREAAQRRLGIVKESDSSSSSLTQPPPRVRGTRVRSRTSLERPATPSPAIATRRSATESRPARSRTPTFRITSRDTTFKRPTYPERATSRRPLRTSKNAAKHSTMRSRKSTTASGKTVPDFQTEKENHDGNLVPDSVLPQPSTVTVQDNITPEESMEIVGEKTRTVDSHDQVPSEETAVLIPEASKENVAEETCAIDAPVSSEDDALKESCTIQDHGTPEESMEDVEHEIRAVDAPDQVLSKEPDVLIEEALTDSVAEKTRAVDASSDQYSRTCNDDQLAGTNSASLTSDVKHENQATLGEIQSTTRKRKENEKVEETSEREVRLKSRKLARPVWESTEIVGEATCAVDTPDQVSSEETHVLTQIEVPIEPEASMQNVAEEKHAVDAPRDHVSSEETDALKECRKVQDPVLPGELKEVVEVPVKIEALTENVVRETRAVDAHSDHVSSEETGALKEGRKVQDCVLPGESKELVEALTENVVGETRAVDAPSDQFSPKDIGTDSLNYYNDDQLAVKNSAALVLKVKHKNQAAEGEIQATTQKRMRKEMEKVEETLERAVRRKKSINPVRESTEIVGDPVKPEASMENVAGGTHAVVASSDHFSSDKTDALKEGWKVQDSVLPGESEELVEIPVKPEALTESVVEETHAVDGPSDQFSPKDIGTDFLNDHNDEQLAVTSSASLKSEVKHENQAAGTLVETIIPEKCAESIEEETAIVPTTRKRASTPESCQTRGHLSWAEMDKIMSPSRRYKFDNRPRSKWFSDRRITGEMRPWPPMIENSLNEQKTITATEESVQTAGKIGDGKEDREAGAEEGEGKQNKGETKEVYVGGGLFFLPEVAKIIAKYLS